MASLSHPLPTVRPAEAESPGERLWLRVLRDAVRDPAELLRLLDLPPEPAGAGGNGFPLLVPRGFVSRIRPGDRNDPLLLQVLPAAAESDDSGPLDAVGDLPSQIAPGAIQKYQGRALLIAAGQCAVNCRYCFRRHYPYDAAPRSDDQWTPAIDAIAADPTVTEVILSGGDPLVLSDDRLRRLVARLELIPHVHTLRIHTRLPIVIPERVTEALCDTLAYSRFTTVVVTHTNHANEIDRAVAASLRDLKDAATLLLNQAVLLRGVNDSVEPLEALSRRLIEVGVTPYYLHQLDRVAGVGHLEVPVEEGLALIAELRRRAPGYAVPRYVREEPGEPHKTVLA